MLTTRENKFEKVQGVFIFMNGLQDEISVHITVMHLYTLFHRMFSIMLVRLCPYKRRIESGDSNIVSSEIVVNTSR